MAGGCGPRGQSPAQKPRESLGGRQTQAAQIQLDFYRSRPLGSSMQLHDRVASPGRYP